MVKKETVGRQGKALGQPAHTREAKLGCVFTQTTWDKEGYALRDPDSTTYTGALETAGEFGQRIYREALKCLKCRNEIAGNCRKLNEILSKLLSKYFRLTIPYFAEYAMAAGPFFELTVRSACHQFLPDRSEHQAAYNPSSEYGFVAVGVPVEGAVRELIRLTELEEIAYEK